MRSFSSDQAPQQLLHAVDRRHVANDKWDRYQGQDVIPMWVADMDFAAPPAVLQGLHQRVDHGVFGYQHDPQPALIEAVTQWLKSTYNWDIQPEWLVWCQGMVPMIHLVACTLLQEGGKSIALTPVYSHLYKGPDNWVQHPDDSIRVPLDYDPERDVWWEINWEALEAAVTEDTQVLMLCNPHNPIGKVYDQATLAQIARFCERHDLIICSDEIHCQLMLDPHQQHTPIATLSPKIAQRTITLMAPSKTYNLAGLGCTFAIIPNDALRAKIQRRRAGILPSPNVLSYAAAEVAYRDSEEWLIAMIARLRENYALIKTCLAKYPEIHLSPLSATYLAFIDITSLSLENPRRYFEQYGLGLSMGEEFSIGDDRQFVRMNFATSEQTMKQALDRFERAISEARR